MNQRPPVTPALRLPEFVALFAVMMSLTAMSIDAMLPALPAIGHSLGVEDSKDTQLIISLFILGMGCGEIFFGPLSDAIGRKKAIYIGIGIYCVGAVLALTATSIEQLLLGRIVQGIGVSGPKIASRALIRDQFEGNAMARIMSFIMMVFILTPMIAPAVGQFILLFGEWRSIFLVYLVAAVLAVTWMGIRQPETLLPEHRIPISLRNLYQSARLIISHPKVMAYTLTAGLIFGTLLSYVSTTQSMFQDLYQAGARFPLYFAILALGAGLASMVNGRLVMRLGMQRLTLCALSGILVVGSAFLLLTWYYQGIPPLWMFMSCCFLLFFCHGMLFGNINAMGMQYLGRVAGIGSSLMSSISSWTAVLVAIPIGRMYDHSVTHIPIAYLASGLLALLLVLAARSSRAGAV
ncbi:multidrug effflux MFS transporter [Pokkaliibacter sp. MBI-7]|uniref:multidrug effflux MFS transporter n=1 Tax=Pokkaliibacter sp. MBI-7 TaxID=3040600 RepID=UPI0024490E32|nr:multidrug effflux MFS transporter [Pokkaliibacter sp. MBI-7]MDH2436190.1 multidrug effflux MFS transporter [Pokkaliibacter sp. MBI-7]